MRMTNRIYKVPLDQKIIDAVRQAMNKEPHNLRRAARVAGICWDNFNFICKLLELQKVVPDPMHQGIITRALQCVEQERRTVEARKIAGGIVNQYWPGERARVIEARKIAGSDVRTRRGNGSSDALLKAKFDRALLGISINCCDDVVIPGNLPPDAVEAALRTVVEGRRALRQFAVRLRARHQVIKPQHPQESVS
jgi:hypothetical protein